MRNPIVDNVSGPNRPTKNSDFIDGQRPSQQKNPIPPIAGPLAIVDFNVSSAEKDEAQRALDVLRQATTPTANSGSPPVWLDTKVSSIRKSGPKPRRPRLDDLLGPRLNDLGYEKIGKLAYRARWSTPDVEHILGFEAWGTPKTLLSGDAGICNQEADAFAERCQDRYGAPLILRCKAEFPNTLPFWFRPMHFSIGRLFGWEPRGSINMSDYSSDELAAAVVEPIRTQLAPFVKGVTSKAALLNLLEKDEEPLRWVYYSEAYRGAVVAHLAASVGAERSETRAVLLRHARDMANGIDTDRLTPETYIDHILDDAEASIRNA